MKLKKKLRNALHFFYAVYGAVRYGFPSRKLFVIGITGTSGKSTTTTLLRQMLEEHGHTVGSLSTVDFYIAGQKKLNDKKMTMLGRTQIQKYLREMVRAKCDIAIVETTSEGRLQHRHRCIAYDTMVLTNLYPEHIDSHGSFENYRQAKQDIFAYVAGLRTKALGGKRIQKTVIVREDVSDRPGFTDHGFEKVILFGGASDFTATDIVATKEGIRFQIAGHQLFAPMYGAHNAQNIVCVAAIALSLGLSWEQITSSVARFHNIDGRAEFIPEAEAHGFQVIVDYAFEPKAMAALYDIVTLLAPKHIIHVFGSTGGGRDVSRRFTVGEFVGNRADICVLTDDDPYDDDSMSIINDIASAVEKTGKVEGETMFTIEDRKEAIQKAIALAQPGDLVLVTGKGSEQALVKKGQLIPWDDRQIVRSTIEKIK